MESVTFINSIRHKQPVEYIEKVRNTIVCKHWWDVNIGKAELATCSEALQLAVVYGNKDYVKFLLANHCELALVPSCCPITFMAIRSGADDILELFCKHFQEERILYKGVPYVDARGCIMEEGRSPLHLAMQLGNVNACRILLKYGANPHVTDSYGLTVLERGLQALILTYDELESLASSVFSQGITPILGEYTMLKHPIYTRLKIKSQNILVNLLELCDSMITVDRTAIPYLRGLLTDCCNAFSREYLGALLYLGALMELLFQPPSLVRTCRHSIRRRLGYRALPKGVDELNLPTYLKHYILHDIKEMIRHFNGDWWRTVKEGDVIVSSNIWKSNMDIWQPVKS